MFPDSAAERLQIEAVSDNVVIIEQKDVFCLRRIDRRVTPHSHANVMLIQVDDAAVPSGLRILHRKTQFGPAIVNHDDLRFAEPAAQGLHQPMAGPRPVNGFDAESQIAWAVVVCLRHTSPMFAKVWVDVRDREIEFFAGGLNP